MITSKAIVLLKNYTNFFLNADEFNTQFNLLIETIENEKIDVPKWLNDLIIDFKRIDDEKFTDETGNYISSTEFRYNIKEALKKL